MSRCAGCIKRWQDLKRKAKELLGIECPHDRVVHAGIRADLKYKCRPIVRCVDCGFEITEGKDD